MACGTGAANEVVPEGARLKGGMQLMVSEMRKTPSATHPHYFALLAVSHPAAHIATACGTPPP